MYVDVLPRGERLAYWVLGVGSIAYILYALYEESKQHQEVAEYLTPGWSFLNRSQDLTDNEWERWRNKTPILLPWYAVHVVICLLAHKLNLADQIRKSTVLAFDAFVLSWYFGPRGILWVTFECFIFYIASLSNSVLAVWIVCLSFLQSGNIRAVAWKKADLLDLYNPDYGLNSFHVAEAFALCVMTSFALEKVKYRINSISEKSSNSDQDLKQSQSINADEKNDCGVSHNVGHQSICTNSVAKSDLSNEPTFIDMLYFVLNLPKFADGPIFTYNDFHEQEKKFFQSPINLPLMNIFQRFFRIAMWAFFIEFQFHYFYFSVLGYFPKRLREMPFSAMTGVGVWQGNFFQIKYLCMYGLSTEILRFQGIVPHTWPRCIPLVYSFTDYWKYFDVGLYKFIKTYIFIPFGGSHKGFVRMLCSSAASFFFIYIFHGTSRTIMIWCLGNFISCSVESLGLLIEKSRFGEDLSSKLGPAWMLRLRAVGSTLLFIPSMIQIDYFFFNMRSGEVFKDRFMSMSLFGWTCFYCNIQNAMLMRQRRMCKEKQM